MTKSFHKIKECGCIVKAISYEIKTDNAIWYSLGGHNHFTFCNKCKQDEENGNDTLYDMWMNDNLTNELEYAGWKEDRK
jgi:hypothetical protein